MTDKEKDQKRPIIIIKKKKKGGHDAHGGSWKVAYADFVTAMMALFLLLWLLSMVSPERKVVLAEFFKHFSVFQHGQSFMPGSKHALKETGLEMGVGQSQSVRVKGMSEAPVEMLEKKIAQDIMAMVGEGGEQPGAEQAGQATGGKAGKSPKEQVLMEITDEGLRIQIVDLEGRPIFFPGSDRLTDTAKRIIRVLAENIRILPRQLILEGHTDGSLYRAGAATNWELSTARASAVRREMEAQGVDSYRFDKIVGYASNRLLIKDNPFDARNRRVSIMVLMPSGEKALRKEAKAEPLIPEIAGQPPITVPLGQPAPAGGGAAPGR